MSPNRVPEHQSRTCFTSDSFGFRRCATRTAERPKSFLHVHTVESCDLNASPKQSVGILGTLHVIFAFEDLVFCNTCTVLADEVKELNSKNECDSIPAHLVVTNVTSKQLHLPLLGFQRSPLHREISYRPVPILTANAVRTFD